MVPTRNEAENIAELLRRLEAALAGVPFEVIFVDDSDDATPGAIAAARERAGRWIRMIHRPPERRRDGLGGAVVEGLREARGPWVCVMDADLQHPPEVIVALLDRARAAEPDVVVASRYRDEADVSALGTARTAVSRTLIVVARVLFPNRLRSLTDPLTGFFLVRRQALELDRLRPRGFKILLEILVRHPELRVSEVPFEFGERHAGESKASVREVLTYFSRLARLRVGDRPVRLGKFALVGLSGLAVNTVLLAAFTEGLGLYYLVSAVLATQGSTLWNFVLTERWVFSDRKGHRWGLASRGAMFFLMNNVALLLRGPILYGLVSVLGLNYLVGNVVSLAVLTIARYALADGCIWRERLDRELGPLFRYSIHDVVTVESEVRLPELEAFTTERKRGRPRIRVRIGKLSRSQSDLVATLAFLTRHTRYDEGLGRFGFAVELSAGRHFEVVASPLLRRSPHVLYTNVVEPILRWALVKEGFALVHGACLASRGERAYLVTARTDTGKTTTVLRTLQRHPYSFLSDDLTLVSAEGRVLAYPKPLTISSHTLQAVNRHLLSRWERLALLLQSRVHSRSGRRFGFALARLGLPAATINALVQMVVPPPKYPIQRLVPDVVVASEAVLSGLVVITREESSCVRLSPDKAIETLLRNCDDAYGFPPYHAIEPFLRVWNGTDLRRVEREIVEAALSGVPAVLLGSRTMDWAERLPAVIAEIEAACGPVGDGESGGRRPTARHLGRAALSRSPRP